MIVIMIRTMVKYTTPIPMVATVVDNKFIKFGSSVSRNILFRCVVD